MVQCTDEEFAQLVEEGVAAIPQKFRKLVDNVGITVAAEPTLKQRERLRLKSGQTLYGLYEGIPQTVRGVGYGGVLPDKITIFKIPIQSSAHTRDEVRELVRKVVWHELAHHFGMDETRVRASEHRRTKN